MKKTKQQVVSIDKYIREISSDESLGLDIVSHKEMPARDGIYQQKSNLPDFLTAALKKTGVNVLYSHQAEAISRVRYSCLFCTLNFLLLVSQGLQPGLTFLFNEES